MKGQESAGSPPGLFGAQPPFAANPAASPVPGSMLAPPGSTGSRAPLARPGGGLHAGGPPVSAKRPRTTPISGRFVFGARADSRARVSACVRIASGARCSRVIGCVCVRRGRREPDGHALGRLPD
ncbi:hypothetical protein T492DRAFT_266064 [Pavlovales sp. CCMP2436]|nr:hypothetical protein T492DRAFT_266064 [Pavlovales sp. CCMP2436]